MLPQQVKAQRNYITTKDSPRSTTPIISMAIIDDIIVELFL